MTLFPACAGVILWEQNAVALYTAFPRVCGGDPGLYLTQTRKNGFSPRVRG